MPRLVGRTSVAVVSLAVGSWVGLGMPRASEARTIGRHLATQATDWAAATLPGIPGLPAIPSHRPSSSSSSSQSSQPQPTDSPRPARAVPAAPPPPPRPSDTPSVPPPPLTSYAPSVDVADLPDPSPWPRSNLLASTRRAWLLAEGPAHAPGDGRRLVTLTFDDGPFPETTPTILHVLARHHVRATFFFIGRYFDGDEARAMATRQVAVDVVAAGHAIGNHTHDHARLPRLKRTQIQSQIDDGATSIERATGIRPILFRPPYGELDPWASHLVRERGLELVLWNVEVGDMKREDPDEMAANLRRQIEYAGGGIVLLHDIRPASAVALEQLLTWLDEHRWDPARPDEVGYDVVDLAEYERATAASPQPFASRTDLEAARSAAWRREHPRSAPIAPKRLVEAASVAPLPAPLPATARGR